MGSVDMQETKILSGELVMLRTTAGHAITNARSSSFILIELKTHQSIFLLSRLLKRKRSGQVRVTVQQGKQSADDSVGGFPTTPVSPLYGSSGLHP